MCSHAGGRCSTREARVSPGAGNVLIGRIRPKDPKAMTVRCKPYAFDLDGKKILETNEDECDSVGIEGLTESQKQKLGIGKAVKSDFD